MSPFLSTLLSCFLLIACVGRNTFGQSLLTVAAASDLSNVEVALADGFRKNEPNVEVRWVTSASGVLAQQIESGAPYDVFLSANAAFVERLLQNRKIEANSVRAYASGRLGLLSTGDLRSLKDLAGVQVRKVALPNPKLAPYGVAAQQALEHEGVWLAVSKKLVYGENVRQTLQLFESGNVDAVLTSDSLLQGKAAVLIPAEWHAPIVQKGGVVSGSKNEATASAFLDFLVSPAGRAVFARFGFGQP